MTNRTFPKINLFLKYIYRTIYIFPLLIGMVILYLSYYSGIGQYGMGLAFFLGSVFYYILKKRFGLNVPNRTNLDSRDNKLFLILNSIFFISFSLSLIVLHHSVYIRPTLYFILITISFFSIFMEIFQIKFSKFSYLSILKIICMSVSFRIGRFFNYPSIPGSDTHFHLNIAKLIVQNGVVPDYSIAYKYSFSCLFQIFEAISSIVLSVDQKNSLFYSIVLTSTIITSLVLYCIVEKMYNFQIALISVLYINISDMIFVQSVTNIGPNAIVFCFFLIILFCVVQQTYKSVYSLIVVIMILCMILSHQLSTFCVFLILSTLLISILIYSTYSNEVPKTAFNSKNLELSLYPNTLTYFFVLMIFHWSQIGPAIGSSFFEKMLYRLDGTITSMISEYLTETSTPTSSYEHFFSTYNFYSNFLYNLGSNFLLMLAIIGVLLIVGLKRKSLFNLSCICVVAILFGLIYAGTYIGLGYLLIPHRFLPFLQLFWVIFASFSTYQIYTISSEKWVKFGLMVIVLLFIFFMLTTPYINRGDAIYATDMVYRDQYTYSELKSLEWSNYFLENQTLSVDSIISPKSLSTIEILNISTNRVTFVDPGSYEISNNILLRQYAINNPNLLISDTFGKTSKVNNLELVLKILQNYNLIYSTNSAKIFQNN